MALPDAAPGDHVLEITHRETGEVAHRSIVTGWTDRQIDKLAGGMGINLNWVEWTIVQRIMPPPCPHDPDHTMVVKDNVPEDRAFRYMCEQCWTEVDVPRSGS